MKQEWKRFAFIGLIVGVVGIVFSAGLFFVRREFDLWQQISLAVTVIGFASYALLDPEAIRKFLTGRQMKYGSNALIFLLAVIGILIIINYVIIENPIRWDLTADKSNTLAEETLNILEALPGPVTVQAFYTPENGSSSTAEELLKNFKTNSNGNLTYEFFNPYTDVAETQNAEIAQDGSIVFWMGDEKQTVTYPSESEFSKALYNLISGEEINVYFLTGHGERSTEETGDTNYTYAKYSLEAKQYIVSQLNLAAEGSIPEDADLIVIAGPVYPVTEAEVKLLSEFMDNGGSMIVMEDPLYATNFGSQADPLANYLSRDWGLTLEDDIVFDLASSYPELPFIYAFADHAITNHVQTNASPFFPAARSISVGDAPDGVSPMGLAYTDSRDTVWGETDWQALLNENAEQPNFDAETDMASPLALVSVAQNDETGARLVVVGDSDFASDYFFTQQGNGDLFILSVDWAAEQENTFNLSTNPTLVRSVIPPTQASVYLLNLLALCVFPGVLIIMMFVIWYLQRKRK